MSEGKLVVWCPFCKAKTANDEQLATLHIDYEKLTCECYNCRAKHEMYEFVKEMGLSTQEFMKLSDPVELKIPDQTSVVSSEAGKLEVWTMKKLLSQEFPDQKWIVNDLIPAETITMLSGDPGNFKTWLTLEIASAVAQSKPFLGKFAVTQGSVLIINEEDHVRYLKERAVILGIPETAPIYLVSQAGVKIDSDKWLRSVLSAIEEYEPKLVILDSFVRIHSGKENEAGDVAEIFRRVRELTKLGVSVLITHHHRKGNGIESKGDLRDIRGSSDIAASLDCHLSVQKKDDQVFVYQNKMRVAKALKPFSVSITTTEGKMALAYAGDVPEKEIKKDEVRKLIPELLKNGSLDRKSINEGVRSVIKIGTNGIGEVLDELRESNEIKIATGQKGKITYSLPETAETN